MKEQTGKGTCRMQMPYDLRMFLKLNTRFRQQSRNNFLRVLKNFKYLQTQNNRPPPPPLPPFFNSISLKDQFSSKCREEKSHLSGERRDESKSLPIKLRHNLEFFYCCHT